MGYSHTWFPFKLTVPSNIYFLLYSVLDWVNASGKAFGYSISALVILLITWCVIYCLFKLRIWLYKLWRKHNRTKWNPAKVDESLTQGEQKLDDLSDLGLVQIND